MWNRDHTVIKETPSIKLAFIVSTKEETFKIREACYKVSEGLLRNSDFKKEFGVYPTDIHLVGETSKIDNTFIQSYIDFKEIKTSESVGFKRSFKCFCGHEFGLDYTETILHPTGLSSWDCLMAKLGCPEYAIVINILPYEN